MSTTPHSKVNSGFEFVLVVANSCCSVERKKRNSQNRGQFAWRAPYYYHRRVLVFACVERNCGLLAFEDLTEKAKGKRTETARKIARRKRRRWEAEGASGKINTSECSTVCLQPGFVKNESHPETGTQST